VQQLRPRLVISQRQRPAGDLAGAAGLPGIPRGLRSRRDPPYPAGIIGAQLRGPQERGGRGRVPCP